MRLSRNKPSFNPTCQASRGATNPTRQTVDRAQCWIPRCGTCAPSLRVNASPYQWSRLWGRVVRPPGKASQKSSWCAAAFRSSALLRKWSMKLDIGQSGPAGQFWVKGHETSREEGYSGKALDGSVAHHTCAEEGMQTLGSAVFAMLNPE